MVRVALGQSHGEGGALAAVGKVHKHLIGWTKQRIVRILFLRFIRSQRSMAACKCPRVTTISDT
jgi:hypothetical protein